MEHQFWHQAWEEGRIGFHRNEVHPQLVQGLSIINPEVGSKVMVPLCGKSLDLLWLQDNGFNVTGVELCPKAIEEFFKDNNLKPEEIGNGVYQLPSLNLVVGDYLAYKGQEEFDFLYDRAALVALPPKMRIDYAKHSLSLLKKGGKLLLVAFEYDQEKVPGPPHCVLKEEIERIYEGTTLELIHEETNEAQAPKFKEAGVKTFTQRTYILTKN